MAITNAQASKINHMNRAAHNVNLGTLVQELQTSASSTTGTLALNATKSGSMLVYALHTNASAVTITTGLSSIVGFNVQAYNAGSTILPGYYVGKSGGTLTIMAVSGCSGINAGDKIYWIAW